MKLFKKITDEKINEFQDLIDKNIRLIEKGLRKNLGYTRKDALLFCRDLKDALKDGEII